MRPRLLIPVLLLAACTDAAQQAPLGPAMSRVPARWIVLVEHGTDPTPVIRDHGLRPVFVFHDVVTGFAAELPAPAALRLDRRVRGVYPDGVVSTTESWGQDRVNQRFLPLDGSSTNDRAGAGVTAYIIDTGIRYDHDEFGGRASLGADFSGGSGDDCRGHGTHVAGTVGGRTYGIAPAVRLIAVRVFGCEDSTPTSVVLAAMDWTAANAIHPAVVNMSLGGPLDVPLNEAVTNLTAAGVHVVVSAGNSNNDACNASPASAPEAITVAATDAQDTRAWFSNFGRCVDLFAPGVGIVSAYNTSSTATATLNGTSMSAPHVTGIAALYLGENPSASPAALADELLATSTKGVVADPLSQNWHMAYSGRDHDDRVVGDPPLPPVAPIPYGLSAEVLGIAKGKGKPATVRLTWSVDEHEDQDGVWIYGWQDGVTHFVDWSVRGTTSRTFEVPAGVWVFRLRSQVSWGSRNVYSAWSDSLTVLACDHCQLRQSGKR